VKLDGLVAVVRSGDEGKARLGNKGRERRVKDNSTA
jgi:hypothetical protein